MIQAVILKPTKDCNADCSFCCAPEDMVPSWDYGKFSHVAEKLGPALGVNSNIIFHGGEPLLIDPSEYFRFVEQIRTYNESVKFGMQTNLTLYKTDLHKRLFDEILEGCISTSMDIGPDSGRTLRGSVSAYQRKLESKMKAVYDDGFKPLVITNITSFNRETAHQLFDYAKTSPFSMDLRFNYRYPAGRARSMGELISPEEYGETLLELLDRWHKEDVDFLITPLDQMMRKVLGGSISQCPWTKGCGGKFLGIEPNGNVYNCGEFADLGEAEYRFGNIFEHTLPELVSSKPAQLISRRAFIVPKDCTTCSHFNECEGGCARDSVLFGNGLYGKFHYCSSWKMVFSDIKNRLKDQSFAEHVRKKMNLHQAAPRYA